MGKKGTKRKTQWRTLSISECLEHSKGNSIKTTSSAHSTTETNIEEAISLGDDYKCSTSNNPLYLKRKSSFGSPSNYKNDYRNSSNPNNSYYNKHNSTSSTSSLYSSRYSYRRRPFSEQNGLSSKYSSYGAGRAYSRGHRTTSDIRDNNKENSKPLFNEDDYTRITTPRQDVIFKKGYFSQPKKYLSSTDTNTNSSATASIVSVEESMSATSVPSLSPEQCSSQADSIDPEQGLMYSFIDQNGVLYVNPYMPNNFDPFTGQMLMLPYGYPPYNMCSPDNSSPSVSFPDSEQNQSSVDSNENPDDLKKDTSNDKETDKSSDEKTEENESEESPKEKDDETTNKDEEREAIKDDNKSESAQNVVGNYFNYEYQQYYPQIYYPFYLPPQFMSNYGADFDTSKEQDDDTLERRNKVQYKCCNGRDDIDGNSTGVSATTTDYSEDDFSDQENIVHAHADTETTNKKETETKKITLNTNVKEFVPRTTVIKSNLNVNVKEFLPKNYTKPQPEEAVIVEPEVKPASEVKKIEEPIPEEKLPSPVKTVKKTSPTLAEKIRKSLVEEQKSKPSPSNVSQVKTTPNRRENTKKKPRKLEMKNEEKTGLSYAEIATKAKSESSKIEEVKPATNVEEKSETKVVESKEVEELKEPVIQEVDTWMTVKPRGKRAKLFKEVSVVEVVEEEIPLEITETSTPIKEVVKDITPISIEETISDHSIVKQDSINSDTTPITATKKKSPKSRSRKFSKKTSSSLTKKAKKLELIEPEFEVIRKTENTQEPEEGQKEDTSGDVEEDDNILTPKILTPATSEQDLTLDQIYSLGRKIDNGFGRNSLDVLTGFDYKFNKNSSIILKEEEEMVLNVIKSINNGFDKKSEVLFNANVLEDTEDVDDKTIVQSCEVQDTIQQCDSETDSISELSSDEICEQSSENEEKIVEQNDLSNISADILDQIENYADLDETDDQSEVFYYHQDLSKITEKSNESMQVEALGEDQVIEISDIDDSVEKIEADQSSINTNGFSKNDLEDGEIIDLQDDSEEESTTSHIKLCNGDGKVDLLEDRDQEKESNKAEIIENILTNGSIPCADSSFEFTNVSDLTVSNENNEDCQNHEIETVLYKNCINQANSFESDHQNGEQLITETISSNGFLPNGLELNGEVKEENINENEILGDDIINPTKTEAQNTSSNTEKPVIPLDTAQDYQNSLVTASTIEEKMVNDEDKLNESESLNHLSSLNNKKGDTEMNSERCDTQIVSYKPNLSECKTSPTNETKGGGGDDIIKPINNFPITTTIDKDFKFPLTSAVRQWLTEETKEKTPEPILRLPNDPNLSSSIKTLMEQQILTQRDDFSSTDDSSYDEDEDDEIYTKRNNSKNLKSNPSDVSFVNNNCSIDNDSDYNSDNQQQRYDDDNTYERVATKLSDSIQQKCDLLDYWDDEFIQHPKKWLNTTEGITTISRSTSVGRESTTSTQNTTISSTSSNIEPSSLTQYDSLYGHSIDYNQLLASNYQFLSNNILSFNNDIDHNTTTSNRGYNNNIKNDTSLNNNNFDNDIHRSTTTTTTHTNINGNNCLKPPEVCCILM